MNALANLDDIQKSDTLKFDTKNLSGFNTMSAGGAVNVVAYVQKDFSV